MVLTNRSAWGFALGTVSEAEIDRWLGQFERLGNHRAVGEHLLQLLDVLPLADLGEALSADSDFYGAELVVGFNNDKWGKSWGTASTLIRKKCASASLLPIAEAVEKGGHPRVLRLVEDGLFSGTEMRAVLDSLRGTRPPVLRKNSFRSSCRYLFQGVSMMETAENRRAPNNVPRGNAMATLIRRRGLLERCWYPRTKTHVRPAVVEMRHPRSQDQFQVALIAGNEEVQAFSA